VITKPKETIFETHEEKNKIRGKQIKVLILNYLKDDFFLSLQHKNLKKKNDYFD